mgnify:CR=1 FL=1
MKIQPTPEQKERVIEYLTTAITPRKVAFIAESLNVSYKEAKGISQAMSDSGLIKRLSYGNEQYTIISRGSTGLLDDSSPVNAKPLKVDKYRRELYAQLEAARSAIPSIG